MASRDDAKTCSDKCRKAMSRWRQNMPKNSSKAQAMVYEMGNYLKYYASREKAIEDLIQLRHHIDATLKENGVKVQSVK
ncbi:MAG: hypothetical protein JO347_04140 [Candidatus Eremiobacteraeota bacterium]|nr:hypothetical protein [Candidatus Eremiobacteraeota bacterium]